MTMAAPARRLDDRLGIVEEVGFLGDRAPRLFVAAYRPARTPVGAVVLCTAVLSEYDHTYTSDVELARALAARGFLTCRFHYRGTGHSDGSPEEMTYETMREDALAVTDWVASELGAEPLIMGLRLGGIIAAAVAQERGSEQLVLWEPAIDGRRYFREAWRADMIYQIKEGGTPTATREAFPALLERDGFVDILGYPLCKSLYESMVERSLVGEAGTKPRRVLIVRGGPASAKRAELDGAVSELRSRGSTVDLEVLDGPIVWWFQGPEMRRNARPQVADMTSRTLDWIEAHGAARASI
jgi:pimeloyl-ACP methyl ester carboxylesterase